MLDMKVSLGPGFVHCGPIEKDPIKSKCSVTFCSIDQIQEQAGPSVALIEVIEPHVAGSNSSICLALLFVCSSN